MKPKTVTSSGQKGKISERNNGKGTSPTENSEAKVINEDSQPLKSIEEEVKLHKEPGFLKHIYEKSKRTAEESLEIESAFISFIIAWTSFCPSIAIMEASKRLCKDDLVDELMIIDAIADNPRRRAVKIYFKTVFNAIRRNFEGYFRPLFPDKKK